MEGMTNTSDTNWQIEVLLKNAFMRTKERFLSYFLSSLIMWGATALYATLGLLLGGSLVFLVALTKSTILVGAVSTVLVLAFLMGLFYFMGWWGIAVIEIITQESKTDVVGALKKVKPLVWSYLGTQAVVGLFMLGLLPFMVISLGVVAILWGYWGAFIAFAFLEKGKRGMDALWYSRSLFNQKFWPITARMLLLTLLLVFIQGLLGSNDHNVLRVASWVVSILSTPFVYSYYYAIYKNLDRSAESVKSTGWVVTSIIGWIITVVVLVAFSAAAAKNLPNMLQNDKFNKFNDKKQFRYNTIPSET
jgi:hypothetical protein